MKPAVLEQWINALESGKYAQCFGAPKKNGRFCAVGVLVDILIADTDVYKWDLFGSGIIGVIRHGNGHLCPISEVLYEFTGTESRDLFRHIIKMNDGDNKTFGEIAEYLKGIRNEI